MGWIFIVHPNLYGTAINFTVTIPVCIKPKFEANTIGTDRDGSGVSALFPVVAGRFIPRIIGGKNSCTRFVLNDNPPFVASILRTDVTIGIHTTSPHIDQGLIR